MRLIEYSPQFIRWEPGHGSVHYVSTLAEAQGIQFRCPGRTHTIRVWFEGRDVCEDADPRFRWTASGTGYEDLTLTPSIDHQPYWHGYITEGEVKNA